MQNYADKLDDNDKYTLLNIKNSTQKATTGINSLIKFMIPVFFDSTLINVYKTKLDELRKERNAKFKIVI